jgi:hypothetical protein
MSEPVRTRNRRQFRRPLLWGGAAILFGAFLGLSSWLWLDVFEALGSTAFALAGSAALALLGVGIICYALVRHVLWVEFGERVHVRRALWERAIEWDEVAALALEEEREDVRPLAPLANVPSALGVPGVGAVARLTGVADIARFDLVLRRLCLRLRSGVVIRCDVQLPQWEGIVALARDRSVPVSQG